VDIHGLQTFVKIIELESFTRAAEELRPARPTVSTQRVDLLPSLLRAFRERLDPVCPSLIVSDDNGVPNEAENGRKNGRNVPRLSRKGEKGPSPGKAGVRCFV
jgi:hypothetical protein